MSEAVTLRDIYRARQVIGAQVRRTPIAPSDALTQRVGAPVHLKLEHRQTTGSFKLRGAHNAIARAAAGAQSPRRGRGLDRQSRPRPCLRRRGRRACAASSACRRLVPRNKVEAIRGARGRGAHRRRSQDDAQAEVDRLVAEEGLAMLPPFDHPDIIAGQGTLGPRADRGPAGASTTVLVPLSGGGLIAGVALRVKAAGPQIRVIGVSMARGARDAGEPGGRPPGPGRGAAHARRLAGRRHRPRQPLDVPHGPRPGRRVCCWSRGGDRRRRPPCLLARAGDRRGQRRGRHRARCSPGRCGRPGRPRSCSPAATSTWRCTARLISGDEPRAAELTPSPGRWSCHEGRAALQPRRIRRAASPRPGRHGRRAASTC